MFNKESTAKPERCACLFALKRPLELPQLLQEDFELVCKAKQVINVGTVHLRAEVGERGRVTVRRTIQCSMRISG